MALAAKVGVGGGGRPVIGFSIQQGEDGCLVIAASIPPPPEPPEAEGWDPEMTPNPNACSFSPTGLRIMRILVREDGWVTSDAIASELQLALERKVQPLLTDLVERNWAEARTGPGGGYMLFIPEDAHPDAYRQALAAWLDRLERHLNQQR